jgi:hypothetical protein
VLAAVTPLCLQFEFTKRNGLMPNGPMSVIPIRRSIPMSESDELVATVAYSLWLSSPFRGGPPEHAFMTALRLVKGKSLAGPFLVPNRKRNLHPIIVMKTHSSGSVTMKRNSRV